MYELRIPSRPNDASAWSTRPGIPIAVAGFVVIGLGWWGASGTKYVYQEIPYVISGGIFGAALVMVGAALFAALLGRAAPSLLAGAASSPTNRSRPTGSSRRSPPSPKH